MRSIVQSRSAHKPQLHRVPFIGWILSFAVLLVAMGACSPKQDRDEAPQARQRVVHVDSLLAVDLSGWRQFQAVSEALTADHATALPRIDEMSRSQIVLDWLACVDPRGPDPSRIRRWLEIAFAQDLGLDVQRKVNALRLRMTGTYRYSRSHEEEIDKLLAPWTEPSFRADFLTQMQSWIAPDRRPQPLRLVFLPALPEIRDCGDYYIDTGVLAAGGNRQLRRQLISMLYRNLMVLPQIEGSASPHAPVAAVVRDIMNRGVAVWIEQAPQTYFNPDHPELSNGALVPEDFYDSGIRMITYMDSQLSTLLARPELTVEEARDFQRSASGGVDLTQVGYAWSAAIVHHLGEQRLQEVCQSPAAFLVAYQEAALRNPVPRPRPGTPGTALAATLPPLEIDVYEKLLAVLEEFEVH